MKTLPQVNTPYVLILLNGCINASKNFLMKFCVKGVRKDRCLVQQPFTFEGLVSLTALTATST